MMSQNHQDKPEVRNDYLMNFRAEEENLAVLENLATQDKALEVTYQERLELPKEAAKPASK